MNWIVIVSFIIWVYVLTVLKRGKMHFWLFCIGSVGMFIFLMIWLQPVLTAPLSRMVAAVSGIVGDLTGMFDSFFQYGIIFIDNGEESMSLYIDYECSGIIELMAFSSLLWFFQVYKTYEKVIVNIIGFLFIFIGNVLRILLISVLIYYFGNDMYFLAHTIFGRLLFYAFSVVLYFYVFTRSQIVRQKVGKFKYDVE